MKSVKELVEELDAVNTTLRELYGELPIAESQYITLNDEYKRISAEEIIKIRTEERDKPKLNKATEKDKEAAGIKAATESDNLWQRRSTALSNFRALERELSIQERLSGNLQSQLKALGGKSSAS
jgi:hypothetical protein